MILKQFELTLNVDDLKVDIQSACQKLECDKVAYILHDKDCEPSHFHIIFQSSSGICLDDVVSAFHLPNDHCIVRINGSWGDIVNYLVHNISACKNKYQYDNCDIGVILPIKKITA